jgi:hypothetical protein
MCRANPPAAAGAMCVHRGTALRRVARPDPVNARENPGLPGENPRLSVDAQAAGVRGDSFTVPTLRRPNQDRSRRRRAGWSTSAPRAASGVDTVPADILRSRPRHAAIAEVGSSASLRGHYGPLRERRDRYACQLAAAIEDGTFPTPNVLSHWKGRPKLARSGLLIRLRGEPHCGSCLTNVSGTSNRTPQTPGRFRRSPSAGPRTGA